MVIAESRVTIHMAASLDGFIARTDGGVDWLETADEFAGGETMDPAFVETFLKTIDCYVMGSRTYETALCFEAQGLGWPYGDKPTFVLTSRQLPQVRDTVNFHSGDLSQFVNEHLRPAFRSIWFVGGGAVSGECLRLALADEVRYTILPILIGDGIRFFDKLDKDIALHLAEVKAYKTGTVELRYEVRQNRGINERHLTTLCSERRYRNAAERSATECSRPFFTRDAPTSGLPTVAQRGRAPPRVSYVQPACASPRDCHRGAAARRQRARRYLASRAAPLPLRPEPACAAAANGFS